MTEPFDPYHQLLGIPPHEQPPNHYRLLGVRLFESNPSVISNACSRQMLYVRTLGGGQYSDISQQFLNELALAKLCLLNPEKRAAYDRRLRENGASESMLPADTAESTADAATTSGQAATEAGALFDGQEFQLVGTEPDEPQPNEMAAVGGDVQTPGPSAPERPPHRPLVAAGSAPWPQPAPIRPRSGTGRTLAFGLTAILAAAAGLWAFGYLPPVAKPPAATRIDPPPAAQPPEAAVARAGFASPESDPLENASPPPQLAPTADPALELMQSLPEGFLPQPGSDVTLLKQRPYFRRVVRPVAEGPEVVFVLAFDSDRGRPFYIMENKFSHRLLRAYLRADVAALSELPARNELLAGEFDDDAPAFNLTLNEALEAAAWLGGRLPTLQEWDHAAGRFADDARIGPHRGDWNESADLKIAVNQRVPSRQGEASDDVSPSGCRDMSGNGWEWTRTVLNVSSLLPREAPPAGPDDWSLLRGWPWTAPRPLRFADLTQEHTQPSHQRSEEISFRVVVEPGVPAGSIGADR